jgi:catechol 2,3-dioxygenase-like lactoylglutathione lyase family enzyme
VRSPNQRLFFPRPDSHPVTTPTPHFICSDVRVADLSRTVRFYQLLGLEVATRGRMKDGTRIVWMRDPMTGQLLELFHLSLRSPLFRPFRRPTRTENALIFGVPNLHLLLPRLRRSGAKVTADFREGDVRYVFVRDSNGTFIELLGWVEGTRGARALPPMVDLASSQRRGARRSTHRGSRHAPGAR